MIFLAVIAGRFLTCNSNEFICRFMFFFTLAVFSVRVRCHSRHTTNKPIYCLLSVLCVGFIPSKYASDIPHFIAQKAITKINGTTLTAICLTDVQLENVFFFHYPLFVMHNGTLHHLSSVARLVVVVVRCLNCIPTDDILPPHKTV